jgi:hypothetical protein
MNDLKKHKLHQLKGKGVDVFHDIPVNYFGQLAERVATRSEQYRRRKRVRALAFTISGLAAGWLIILGIMFLFNIQSPEGNLKHQLADGANGQHLYDSMEKTTVESFHSDTIAFNADGFFIDEDSNSPSTTPDLFDELDAIPLEVIMEYIYKHDEFEF